MRFGMALASVMVKTTLRSKRYAAPRQNPRSVSNTAAGSSIWANEPLRSMIARRAGGDATCLFTAGTPGKMLCSLLVLINPLWRAVTNRGASPVRSRCQP